MSLPFPQWSHPHSLSPPPPPHLPTLQKWRKSENTFNLFLGNNLLVKSALDYETQPKIITLSIQASDGFCDSEVYTLTVRLVDVNEPPILLPADQTLESCEGLVSSRGRCRGGGGGGGSSSSSRSSSSSGAVRLVNIKEHPTLPPVDRTIERLVKVPDTVFVVYVVLAVVVVVVVVVVPLDWQT